MLVKFDQKQCYMLILKPDNCIVDFLTLYKAVPTVDVEVLLAHILGASVAVEC